MKNRHILFFAACLFCGGAAQAAGVLWSNASRELSTALAEVYWSGGDAERELGDYQRNWKGQPVYFFRLTADSPLTDGKGNNALVSTPNHPAMIALANLALKGAITPRGIINILAPFGAVIDATALLDDDSFAEALGHHSFIPGERTDAFYVAFSYAATNPLLNQPPAVLVSSVSSVVAGKQTVAAALFQDDTLFGKIELERIAVPEPSAVVLLALGLCTLSLRRRRV